MADGKPRKKEREQHLITKMVIIEIISVLVVSSIITFVSVRSIKDRYYKDLNGELSSVGYLINQSANNLVDGAWSLSSDGRVMKGTLDVTDDFTARLDEVKRETDVDVSVIIDGTYALTTLRQGPGQDADRYQGTLPDSIKSEIDSSGHYFETDMKIGPMNYCVYYRPLVDSDGSVSGYIMSGMDSDQARAELRSLELKLILTLVGLVLAMAIIGLALSRRLSSIMKRLAENIETLADGNLTLNRDNRAVARKDEIGLIAKSIRKLDDKLHGVIAETMRLTGELNDSSINLSTSSDNASAASSQVSSAVDDIAKGATDQADSVQTAASDTTSIGGNIEDINTSVSDLNEYTEEMTASCKRTVAAIDLLVKQAQESNESVKAIGSNITSTNESVQEISKFSGAITDIASQTNLLSLNASIEAARAGEAGRGFAVVADQIRALADQSKQSADEISQLVENLLSDSASSVASMSKLSESFEIQDQQLEVTKKELAEMNEKMQSVASGVETIASRIEELNTSKTSLSDIISDLSAISEENAASTQETNASMEELNSTFAVISEAASSLKNLAQELKSTVAYFHE